MGRPSEGHRELEERAEALADKWYAAIADTCYPTKSVQEVRHTLRGLSRKAIELLAAAPLEHAGAEEIGASLAYLHYIRPDALEATLRVLREQLSGMCPDEGAVEYMDRLATLLAAIATGFFRQVCTVVLGEQETIRAALVTEIEKSGRALQIAHDELEQRVKDRTAELARANEELRVEVIERRRVQDALRESEEKYRKLVEDMREVVYVANLDGELSYVSPAVTALLGYDAAEIIGHRFAEFVYPEDLDEIQQSFQSLLAGESRTAEYRFVTKSGEIRWGRTSSSPILEASHVVGFQGMLADITESVQAREALQASEERWRLLVENAPVLVVTVGPDLTVGFINRNPGQEPAPVEVVGTSMLGFVAPEYRDAASAAIERVFETARSEYLEVPVISSRRRDAWYGVHLGPLRQGDRVAEVMLVARDMTEEKKIADMKDALIRDASHELRTPLAKVQMSLELLVEMLEKEDLDRQRAIQISGFATRSTERMLRTVENILDLSRLEAGTWPDERQPIPPRVLIHEAVTYATPLSAAKGLELVVDLPASLPVIRGDWDKLCRVLHNLFYNAIKFSDAGQILVTAEDMGAELMIGVRDQGQGILPENLERVFERFFQEKVRQLGAGLGLAICKAIVEEHGGRIWAESAGRGQGAAFWFTLPTDTGAEEQA